MSDTPTPGTLIGSEPHPAAYAAKDWIARQSPETLMTWREAFASMSLADNGRLSVICGETLERLLNGQMVSDRYVLGLAWVMQQGEIEKR